MADSWHTLPRCPSKQLEGEQMIYSRIRLVGAVLVLMGSPLWAEIARAESDLQVADGLKVTLEYTLTLQTIGDRKSTRLNSSHRTISYAVFCLKKKKHNTHH